MYLPAASDSAHISRQQLAKEALSYDSRAFTTAMAQWSFCVFSRRAFENKRKTHPVFLVMLVPSPQNFTVNEGLSLPSRSSLFRERNDCQGFIYVNLCPFALTRGSLNVTHNIHIFPELFNQVGFLEAITNCSEFMVE